MPSPSAKRPLALLLCIVLLAGPASVLAASNDHPGRGRHAASPPYAQLAEEIHWLPRPDGIEIQVGLVRPLVPPGMKVPVVLMASPYFSDFREYGVRNANMDITGVASPDPDQEWGPGAFHTARLIDTLVPQGFAVAFMAVRGTGGSGGCWDMVGPLDRGDLDAAITWLARRPWSAGDVGMIGMSAPGVEAWGAASLGNPHLRTIVPIQATPSYFDAFVRNGTMAYVTPVLPPGGALLFGALSTKRDAELVAESADCPEAVEGQRSLAAWLATGEEAELAWWDERDPRKLIEERYRGSVLLVHSFQDPSAGVHLNVPWVESLAARGVDVTMWLGQWSHTFPYDTDPTWNPTPRFGWDAALVAWFGHSLRGDPKPAWPRVEVADNTAAWRNETQWPPADRARVTLHLAAAPGAERGALQAAEAEPGRAAIVVDPGRTAFPLHGGQIDPQLQGAEGWPDLLCPTCLVFAGEPVDEPTRYAGFAYAHLRVTPTAPTGVVFAHLLAEHADGRISWLSTGALDLRFAEGGRQARAIVPGEAMDVTVEIDGADVLLRPGDTLLLTLSQGGAGRALPGGYFFSAHQPAPLLLDTGNGASTLRLETIER